MSRADLEGLLERARSSEAVDRRIDELCLGKNPLRFCGERVRGDYCSACMNEAIVDVTVSDFRADVQRILGKPKPHAKPAEQATSPWPSGCLKPNSCARHFGCMYARSADQCRHYGRDLKADVEAALLTQQEASDA